MNQVNQELFLLVVPFPADQDATVEQSGLEVLNHEADPLSMRGGDGSRSQVRYLRTEYGISGCQRGSGPCCCLRTIRAAGSSGDEERRIDRRGWTIGDGRSSPVLSTAADESKVPVLGV